MKTAHAIISSLIILSCSSITKPTNGQAQVMTYEDYIRKAAAAKEEIDVFLKENV